MRKIYTYFLPVLAVSLMASCAYEDKKTPGYEYMPNMYRSPSYETYEANPNFQDSTSARPSVKGTIARGNSVHSDLDMMPYPYPNTTEGYEKAGAELKNPVPLDEFAMSEGKRLYDNYCLVCHGSTGMGDGPVVQRNGPKPPAYNSEQLRNLPVGKMYHAIHWGKNMMGSHASQLTPTERWKIIHYIQTMQKPAMADNTAAAEKK
ncbi:MAG: cytochrome c [Bacteroidetes bacterium]|nr:MAG: cytochrome c [Bacteroidota bacterium]REK03465.1 MAG: cytochrome c [Bacteroidota bacterium]REK34770.1 MAG: cytochrome c [Bacteroidota bacterium]REK51351.1 MAG: cytochrome c [Bacteroidota bacterium]